MNRQELSELTRKILEDQLSCDDVSVHVCMIDHMIRYEYGRYPSGEMHDIEMYLPVYLQQAPQSVAEDIISCLAVKIKTGRKIRYSRDTMRWIAENRSSR